MTHDQLLALKKLRDPFLQRINELGMQLHSMEARMVTVQAKPSTFGNPSKVSTLQAKITRTRDTRRQLITSMRAAEASEGFPPGG